MGVIKWGNQKKKKKKKNKRKKKKKASGSTNERTRCTFTSGSTTRTCGKLTALIS